VVHQPAARQPLRLAIREAAGILAGAGVASPRRDAEELAAHVLGVERTRLPLVPLVDPGVIEALRALVSRRAERVPLQHLTGLAALGPATVSVGPGVFVPRPETELVLEWALARLAGRAGPVLVDLCTGSGALALAVAAARPDAAVYAVERDRAALSWARRNVDAAGAAVTLVAGDVADGALLTELDAAVDVVTCNPPYVPAGSSVPPEVACHDPARAVFAGPDGLEVIRPAVALAARLLRPGGALAIEHDESQGGSVRALLRARGVLTEVTDHRDLAGKPRFATAHRARMRQ
jgi:release factor glutamine methyltransferase